jgi:hypothetical protein
LIGPGANTPGAFYFDGLTYDPKNDAFYGALLSTRAGDQLRIAFKRPAANATDDTLVQALVTPIPQPCAYSPPFIGVDASGNSVFGQRDTAQKLRGCVLPPTGERSAGCSQKKGRFGAGFAGFLELAAGPATRIRSTQLSTVKGCAKATASPRACDARRAADSSSTAGVVLLTPACSGESRSVMTAKRSAYWSELRVVKETHLLSEARASSRSMQRRQRHAVLAR